jgi:2-(3-amino-3-carboxypropyl)histidine synthase
MIGVFMDKEEAFKQLKRMNAKKILLQIPDGLKPQAFDIFNYFASDFNVIVSSSSFYGACDIGNREIYEGVDCIVQLGHTEIPNINYPLPVIFIEYYYNTIEIDDSTFDVLKSDGINKIGLLSSVQYYNEMLYIKDRLERNGFSVYVGKNDGRLKYPGQVLGCNFSTAHSVSLYVDAFLLISTGLFHGIGVQLSSDDRDVYILDLNDKKIHNIRHDTDIFLKKRYARMERALNAKRFCVVVDTKIGQYRMKIANEIYEKLKALNKNVIMTSADNINPADFENFMCDAIIFTGCPRVPIDDEEKFKMPVLTPTEFDLIFGFKKSKRYVMDEIVSVDKQEENKNTETKGINA